eukprot:TRINITY_DN10875_c0_g1_i10.p2 TRINITY_DN10875_c0_g1~~TRINITY_DN10875_c0_g1_i10.p2  ORF type:complete len:164 (-),score=55.16 TRINITY_DN10875_c0_g1_i10:60-551(-)
MVVTVAPGLFSLDNTQVEFPTDCFATLPGPLVSVCDGEGNLRSGCGGGDGVVARLVPLFQLQVKAKPDSDGSYKVAFPANSRGEFDVHVQVNEKIVPGGPWRVEVDKKPLESGYEGVAQKLMPNSFDVLERMLLDCTPGERSSLLKVLSRLAGNVHSDSSSSD